MSTDTVVRGNLILKLWANQGEKILRINIVLMFIAASVWLGYQFWRLLFHTGKMGAIDLGQRHLEVQRWFAGEQVYGVVHHATYPPASMAILWPFTGWMSFHAARWLWAGITVLFLYWMVQIFLEGSRAQTRPERAFIALLPLATYGTGACIGNGQLIVYLVPCLITSLLINDRSSGNWQDNLLTAFLFICALVKPSVAAPFFWILLFAPGRLRTIAAVLIGYLVLTLFSGLFQTADIPGLIRNWLANCSRVLATSAASYSNNNLHSLLFWLDRLSWLPYVTVTVFVGLGVWTYRFRKADIWVLLGVTALVSRFYTYHGHYDDVLILIPMLTLFRLVKSDRLTAWQKSFGGLLFAAMLLFMMAPGGLYLLPPPWNRVYVVIQTSLWMTLMAFLMYHAWWLECHFALRTNATSSRHIAGV
jgi:hypothetical protein